MFEKILLAIDESRPSEHAVPAAAALAKRFNGEVIVLRLSDRPEGEAPAAETWMGAASLIDRVVMDLKDCGVNARPELWAAPASGTAASIAGIVRHEAVDLIVLGVREPGLHATPEERSAETLVERVLHLTHRPVLVLP